MINISRTDKDRCRVDPLFLRGILEKELEKTKDALISSPLESLQSLQGRAQTLNNVIKLLS